MNSISSSVEHPAYAIGATDEEKLLSGADGDVQLSIRNASGRDEASSYRHPVVSGTVKVLDVVAILLATLLLASAGSGALTSFQADARNTADLMSLLVVLLWPKSDRLLHLPKLTRFRNQVRYIGPSVIVAGLVQVIALFLLDWTPRRAVETSFLWCLCSAGSLFFTRAAVTCVLTRRSVRQRLTRKIAIIGDGIHASLIADRLRQNARHAFETVGLYSDADTARDVEGKVAGSISDLVSFGREHTLHAVIIAVPPSADHEQQVKQLMVRLRSMLADVYIMPHLAHGPDLALPFESFGSFSLMVLQRRPLTDWQVISKLALDLLLAVTASLILAPLMLAVACAIKLDSPGPVLFRQSRLGFNNRPFMVFKFRSMYVEMTDHTAARQTSRNDPRVTRVGKWLRKLSIDELPQLLNVLRNEMSLVGPRPHAPETRAGGKLLGDALAEYVIRHQVKPGITGWAQVNGSRGELVTTDDLRVRVALDLEYIQRWSIWFDIKIMILTIFREVVSPNSF